MSLADTKQTARRAAMNRRKAAFANASGDQTGPLRTVLRAYAGRTLSGYAPIRTEIDPTPAMAAHQGPVALPVVTGEGQPLRFRAWHPGCTMVTGPFGAAVPADGQWLVPEVLIVPLLAFDRQGGRLGYGGGFYDRTLAQLRQGGEAVAIGFAFGAQEADDLPLEPTDAPLDLVVTERRVLYDSR
ncbi:5-formyltetrahydrofolate cyclo-ligase [Palleronia pelagia]|uniref:5-formyltetrahydrofolate cyclo-ligase n=1 Tax=Palleronia pelagia TaxID=387096 RepID=A0A1H8GYZ7_9RHOB|nr:5-formyltetrahydrofolate cyclo-ligase [Palleronia pelagia]SEN49322.1 5-formyltetrahydrofolate cyclo-ligase [Palleronia pelagia]